MVRYLGRGHWRRRWGEGSLLLVGIVITVQLSRCESSNRARDVSTCIVKTAVHDRVIAVGVVISTTVGEGDVVVVFWVVEFRSWGCLGYKVEPERMPHG